MKKYDFRLNKQELTSLLMLFLAKAGKSETLSTQNNVEYRISPSEKLIFIYGKHNNAQEVNNNFDYDIIDAVVEKYVNGYFVKSYVFGLKIKDFQLDMHGKLFNNNNYATSYFLRNIDFYKYMYLIFGENYKTALIDYLKTSCQQKLKEENDRYLRNLNVINRAKGNMLRKSAEKRSHEGVRKGILKSYNSRLEFATTLNMDTLTID